MQKKFNRNFIFVFFFIFIFFNACRSDNSPSLPRITTSPVSSVTSSTAVAGGNILYIGGGDMRLTKGICYSTHKNATIADKVIGSNSEENKFTVDMISLAINTTYYVRAYAINAAGTAYGDEVVFTTLLELSPGVEYAGGMVFYVDPTGQHGLAVAPYNQSDAAEWGCYGTNINGTVNTIGSGQSNTTAIVNGCSITGTAAQICNTLTLNGYDDWYLPSKDELNLIYTNLYLHGLGNFTKGYYWSSSQYNNATSWAQSFQYGYQLSSNKSGKLGVRAVRAF